MPSTDNFQGQATISLKCRLWIHPAASNMKSANFVANPGALQNKSCALSHSTKRQSNADLGTDSCDMKLEAYCNKANNGDSVGELKTQIAGISSSSAVWLL